MGAINNLLAAGLLLSGSLCNAIAHPKRSILRKRDNTGVGVPHAFNFTMPIDHFTKSNTFSTYKNEYWVNDTFYKPGGPVFLVDLGETGSSAAQVAMQISYEPAIFSTLLERYNGIAIAWQHRFYGYSLPFPVDEYGVPQGPQGGLSALKYLTQEQAMEDVVYFAKNIEETQKKLQIPGDNVLHPDKTPWVFMGGSYPGMRAALLRVRNPEIIYASWASSAPLQPDSDGSAYFNAALRSLRPNCTSDFHQLVKWSDQQYDNKNATSIRLIQERWWLANALATNQTNILNATAAANLTAADIAQFFQEPLSLGEFQYHGPATLQMFCDYMETYDARTAESKTSVERYSFTSSGHKLKPADDGIFNRYGPEATLDAFLAAFVWAANPHFESMAEDGSDSSVDSVDSGQGMDLWGNVSWAWQCLNEFGHFFGWSPTYERFHPKDSVLSKYYTWEQARLDQIAMINGIDATKVPAVSPYWAEYGGWGMQPSNVMFTDGEWDPWRAYSAGSQEYDLGKPVRNYTTEMPRCGLPLEGNKLYGWLYEHSAHVSDQGENTEWQSSHSLGMFMHALDAWLPCFSRR